MLLNGLVISLVVHVRLHSTAFARICKTLHPYGDVAHLLCIFSCTLRWLLLGFVRLRTLRVMSRTCCAYSTAPLGGFCSDL
jgi:hypothetical protein